MKKIILFLLLLSTSGILLAQSTVDVTNTTSAVLDSAGVWQPTSWRNVTGYNSITLTIKSDKSSATNGVKIYWADKVNNLYRIMDSVITTYTAGTPFNLTLSVTAPYLKVKYTNTTSAQTSFSFITLLHVGQQSSTSTISGMSVLPVKTADSYYGLRDTWSTAKDTSTYNFANNYLVCYVSITNTSAVTADTLTLEHYSISRNGWTTQAIGFRDVLTDYLEADNTTVIIPASTNKMFEVNMYRPGQVRVRPKTITGRTTMKTEHVYFKGVN